MFGWKKDAAHRRSVDLSGAADGGLVASRGLISGTRVGTSMGWRGVEALAPGDMVLTFDNGLQPLVEVRRDTFWMSDRSLARDPVVAIPAGAMGNTVNLQLLVDQGILIESEAACDAQGDPFAVVRASALDGFRGIRRTSAPAQMEVITLVFEGEEVIYAEGGVLVHCPRAVVRLDDIGRVHDGYEVLPNDQAVFLVECMALEDAGDHVPGPNPLAA